MREDKLPLRTVLQNFINHVDTLEANKNCKNERYDQEFQELKKLTEDLKSDSGHTCHEGEKECNRRKNRYKDILPYDKTRVEIQSYPGIPGSDYINANYIRGASGSRAYIASQGPLSHTVSDFWRMVVECEVQVIVMASNETEGGKHKCECYWANNPGTEKQFGNVQVTFVKSRQVCPDFLVRTFKIKYPSEKNKTEERIICQFHYVLWPDHGVPDTVRPLLDMVRLVRDCQASETLPVLVHCSAGCGRTGTICAIDYVWGLLRTGKLTENLDLFGIVKEMRHQRVAMVQTREQYMLLHQAVKELFKDRLKLIDAHPYENVATDGNPLILKVKENDYEELFVSQEKQDKSMKCSPPSSTPSSATPDGSLTRTKEIFNGARDSMRKSASTSSLNAPSGDPHKMSSTRRSEGPSRSRMNEPSSSYTNLRQLSLEAKLSPKVYPVPPPSSGKPKRGSGAPSKMEKDAENFAQMAKQKLLSPRKPGSQLSISANENKKEGKGLYVRPIPPPRSHSPSPDFPRKFGSRAIHPNDDTDLQLFDTPDGQRRKSTEIVRRPSIQKLKELFEKQGQEADLASSPVTKLSRSASSVTMRPSLSIPAKTDSHSLRHERRNCFGSQENISRSNATSSIQICPPPPPIQPVPVPHMRLERSCTSLALTTSKPPSSPRDEDKYRVDERPVLPIKKSKSFRWSRTETDTRPFVPRRSDRSSDQIDGDELDGPLKGKNSERYKLSVYKDPSERSVPDGKPSIPPKKNITDRYKNIKLVPLQAASLQYQPDFRSVKGNSYQNELPSGCAPNSSNISPIPGTVRLQSNRELLSEVAKDLLPNKSGCSLGSKKSPEYVNTRVIKSSESPKYAGAPVPSKRNERGKHDYANIAYEPSPKVSPLSSVGSDTSPRRKVSADYESVNFGEALDPSEVLETVNYELVTSDVPGTPEPESDSYLNKDLDVIARQVYQDCQEYLLGSNNKSPVPSLVPTEVSRISAESSSPNSDGSTTIKQKDLEHVKSKVTVPPQGLRNRERRNSYRQAVNAQGASRVLKHESPRKPPHQYERIWFAGHSQDQSKAMGRHSGDPQPNPQDLSTNLDKQMNISGKEALFKDKLEELNHIMSSLERKHSQMLPDLSEEELSSKHSGSTSSIPSKSGHSSRSSDRAEPIYANIDRQFSYGPSNFMDPESHLPGLSQFGTLATTTSQPYKPRSHHDPKDPSFLGNSTRNYTATLPVRSTVPSSEMNSFTKPTSHKVHEKNIELADSKHGRSISTGFRQKPRMHHPRPIQPPHKAQGITKRKDSRPYSNSGPGAPDPVGATYSRARDSTKETAKPSPTNRHSELHSRASPLRHTASSPYLSPPPPKPLPPSYHSHKLKSPLSPAPPTDLPLKPTKNGRAFEPTPNVMSSDSSEGEEGVFHKINPPNIFRKLKGSVQASKDLPIKNPSSIAQERRNRDDGQCDDSSPTESPKAFTKALDKLRIGSKNVAANFKSYLKGDKTDDSSSHMGLQKSLSCTTANMSISQVTAECKYPVRVPKKPSGPRAMPAYPSSRQTEERQRTTKAKEQYL